MNLTSVFDYRLTQSTQVLQTSAAGDRLTLRENIVFERNQAAADVAIRVSPNHVRQTLRGIGSSFSEAAAFVLAHLEPERRLEVMQNIFGEQGANFSLARTPIGSTEFSVEGR